MRKIARIAAAAALVWLVVANDLPAKPSPGADWTRPLSIENDRITSYYPRAWHAAARGNTIVISSPSTWIWLASYGRAHAEEFAARPEHFELKDEDRRFQTCSFDFVGWNLTFTDHGQVAQAIVRVDPGAPRADAVKLLDRLEIG
jgi:hypothetical protein